VYIHFDFDNWEPDLMEDYRAIDIKKKGKFRLHKMLPPSPHCQYFYSL